jgi:hypothetical protein
MGDPGRHPAEYEMTLIRTQRSGAAPDTRPRSMNEVCQSSSSPLLVPQLMSVKVTCLLTFCPLEP